MIPDEFYMLELTVSEEVQPELDDDEEDDVFYDEEDDVFYEVEFSEEFDLGPISDEDEPEIEIMIIWPEEEEDEEMLVIIQTTYYE